MKCLDQRKPQRKLLVKITPAPIRTSKKINRYIQDLNSIEVSFFLTQQFNGREGTGGGAISSTQSLVT